MKNKNLNTLTTFCKNLKYLVYGLGITGNSVIKFLKENNINFITYTDDDEEEVLLDDIDVLIKSPGISYKSKLLRDANEMGILIISDIELWSWFYPELMSNTIVITGTCGKTTSVLLLQEVLKTKYSVHIGGNIGIPIFDLPIDLNALYIIEASSYMLKYTHLFHPHIAIFLNYYPNHLDHHETIDDYFNAKANIVNNLGNHDLFIYNDEQQELVNLVNELNAPCISFSSLNKSAHVYFDGYHVYYQQKLYIENFSLLFKNSIVLKNALSIIPIIEKFELSLNIIKQKFIQYESPEYRFSLRQINDSIKIYNDAKSTNFLALKSSIQQVQKEHHRHLLVIVGGEDRQERLRDLLAIIPDKTEIMFTGALGKRLYRESRKSLFIHYYETLRELFEKGLKFHCLPNTIVLYSPGAPSFDQYPTYIKRGEEFDELLSRYKRCLPVTMIKNFTC